MLANALEGAWKMFESYWARKLSSTEPGMLILVRGGFPYICRLPSCLLLRYLEFFRAGSLWKPFRYLKLVFLTRSHECIAVTDSAFSLMALSSGQHVFFRYCLAPERVLSQPEWFDLRVLWRRHTVASRKHWCCLLLSCTVLSHNPPIALHFRLQV